LYFVIQVTSRKENKILEKIKKVISDSFYDDIFIPTRIRQKKVQGRWLDYEEVWFPGYIFVETNKPSELARELRNIGDFTKIVGFKEKEEVRYIPLSEMDSNKIDRLLNRKVHALNSTVELSKINIEAGQQIRIISGPLLGLEGTVVKYNLHKRIATIEIVFFNEVTKVNVGIELVENIELTSSF